jgi:glutathione S-transferase
MKLYYSKNLNPRVAVAVARYLKSPVEYIRASPRHPQQEPAFRAINPNTLVPVLVEESSSLWETDAIACRLSSIAGSDFWRRGEQQPDMIRWISWSAHHLTKAAGVLYFENLVRPTFSDQAADPAMLDEALQDFRRFSRVLDRYLENRRWLLGEAISYADFRVATPLPFASGAGLPLAEFPNVHRWHAQLCEIDAWRAPFDGLA